MRPRVDPLFPQFPPPETARPNGLVLVGGCLSPEWMLTAYSQGIFPMPIVEGRRETLAWFSPDPRGILEFEDLYVSSSLARTIKRGKFRITHDQAFEQVVEACSQPRHEEDGIWITPSLMAGYQRLHELGHAHSVEAWEGGELVGGIFGIAHGGFFAGESMFRRATDASKVVLVTLMRHLQARGFELFDVQWTNEHTRSLGAKSIRRQHYLRRLAAVVNKPVAY